MQKLGFPAMKSTDQRRFLKKPFSATGRATAILIPSPPPSDAINYGSFATLKLTAEKLIQEQGAVKTDLEMAHKKLIKATEQIHMLEAKLQDTINENAKLRVKQNEDAKLLMELDSKISSTKALCNQLSETHEQLSDQTRTAEEAKKFFEEKLLDNSKVFEEFKSQIDGLSAKLDSANRTIRIGEEKLLELRNEKVEMEKCFRDERYMTDNIIEDKDALIKQLGDAVEENKTHLQMVNSQLNEAQHELTEKEKICNLLRDAEEVLRKEKYDLQFNNQDLRMQQGRSLHEIRELRDLVSGLLTKIVELEKESSTVSDHVAKVVSSFETFYGLSQQEKYLALKCAQAKFDKLYEQFNGIKSENTAFNAEIEELKGKIVEFQKAQEFAMVQQAEECRLVEDKIRRLESEAETLALKKKESEKLVTDLEEKVNILLEASSLSENNMHEMLEKISKLGSENHILEERVHSVLREKEAEIGALKDEIVEKDQCIDSLNNQIGQLHDLINDEKQLHASFLEREKELQEQKAEIHTSLVATECKLTEERKKFDMMLEGKQLELSKHLKELSQRNDQAINEIRKRYEEEKVEISTMVKEKADKLIKEMESKCEEKISEVKEEAQQCLMRVKEEHRAEISKIQQDSDQKEISLRAHHKEELQRAYLQAENELRERTSSLRKEHEIQMKSLNLQHEDDCTRLQEELDIQRAKEEKQRELLQLQLKVISESQQDGQEVNSRKDYSVSSKMKDSYGGKERRLALTSPESRRKDLSLAGRMRTPVANLLKKGNSESVNNIPKHRKVTRHEYEVEMQNGKTITKRRRTKSTVMFEGPNTQKIVHSKTPYAHKDGNKITKVPDRGPHPANIGDLFSEGSLNPYVDDPYAFD